MQYNDHLELYIGKLVTPFTFTIIMLSNTSLPRSGIRLQNVVQTSFSVDGQTFCAWERIGDHYYWHLWDLRGVCQYSRNWRWRVSLTTLDMSCNQY